ncbi:MAG: MXAN_6640 family putative metalloprotease [bacterium]
MRFPAFISLFVLFFATLILSNTSALADKVNAMAYSPKELDKKSGNSLLRSIDYDSITLRPSTTHFIDSKSGNFRIHYNIEGPNAISLVDLNNNGTPDYLDSVIYYCDYVQDFYTRQLGYMNFALDTGGGGSKAYDIYLWDLGNYDDFDRGGIYGYNSYSDGEILPHRTFPRSYSYSIIDNNFSPTDTMKSRSGKYQPAFYTTGINALKITLAHELHHAVQNFYGLAPQAQGTFVEMTSTFYEYRLFPEVTDYLQYANLLLSNPENMPLGVDGTYNGYCYSILFHCLYAKYGDGAIKDIWDLAYDGIPYFYALDSTLRKNGTTIKKFWYEFMDWLYYTGSRAKKGQYFQKAAQMDTLKFFKTLTYSEPEKGESYLMLPFEFRGYRFNFLRSEIQTNDTIDAILTNCDLAGASLNSGLSKEYTISVSNFEQPHSEYIEPLELYFNFESEDDLIIPHIYVHPGTLTHRMTVAFPNPYDPRKESAIYFPIPKTAKLNEMVLLTVYSTAMLPLYSLEIPVGVANTNLTAQWTNVPDDIANGVHIFTVKYNTDQVMGKFVVLRK